jgi:Divergent InlB B-repeat domain
MSSRPRARHRPDDRAAITTLVMVGTVILVVAGVALLSGGNSGHAAPRAAHGGAHRIVHHARGAAKWPRHHHRRRHAPTVVSPPPPVALTIDHQGAGRGTVSVLGGGGCSGDCTFDVTQGRVLMLTAAAFPGARFDGWTAPDTCRATTSCDVQIRSDMTVAAHFSAAPVKWFAITINTAGPGSVDLCGGAHSCSRTTVLTTSLGGDASARLDVGPRGSCVSGCTFRRGAHAKLRVSHKAHATVKWSGARCRGDTCTVRMTRDRKLRVVVGAPPPATVAWHATHWSQGAELRSLDYTLDVRTSAGGSVQIGDVRCRGAVPCRHQYAGGTSLTLVAQPDSGYAFAGWAGCAAPARDTCDVALASDRTVVATFTPAPGG